MEKKVRFETLAELQETYPVGSVIHKKTIEYYTINYFYNKKDFDFYKRIYAEVEPIDDVSCRCKNIEIIYFEVEGYLYDGKYWRPVRNTWDGWLPYDEDDFR